MWVTPQLLREMHGVDLGESRDPPALRRDFPDFLAVLNNGERLIVETKGRDTPDVELKAKAAERWCRAINRDGRYGVCSYHLIWEMGELEGVLRERGREVA